MGIDAGRHIAFYCPDMNNDCLPSFPEIRDWMNRHRELMILVITAAISLIAIQYYVRGGGFADHLSGIMATTGWTGQLQRLVCWAMGSVFFYLCLPMIVLCCCGRSISKCGWTIQGLSSHWKTYLALFIPVSIAVILVSSRADFQANYPFLSTPANWPELLIWEICYITQFIALEFFFRGFMVLGLRKHVGNTAAVLIMLLPYVMIHFGKPLLETCGALIAGAVLGLLSLRNGSMAGGACLHVMVAVQMDLFALIRKGWF